jgi:hypothetical protein
MNDLMYYFRYYPRTKSTELTQVKVCGRRIAKNVSDG